MARANRHLVGAAATAPLAAGPAVTSSLVGTAADLGLRGLVAPSALADVPAARTALRFAAGPHGPHGADVIEPLLGALSDALPAAQSNNAPGAWEALARPLLVLAAFEQASRSVRAWRSTAERLRDASGTVAAFVDRLAAPADVADLAMLLRASAATFAATLTRASIEPSPVFDIPGALLADGDLVSGDLLVDFKATSTRRPVGREVLWQLCGYALADADDRYGIRRVGVIALRWQTMVTWPLDALLADLAADEAPHDRETLAREFRETTRAGRRRARR